MVVCAGIVVVCSIVTPDVVNGDVMRVVLRGGVVPSVLGEVVTTIVLGGAVDGASVPKRQI